MPGIVDIAYRLRRRFLAITGWPTRGVKAMVSDSEGRLLLVRHNYGRKDLWMLPGGGIGRGETPAAAVRREVLEEVGCTLQALQPIGRFAARAEGRRDTVHLFAATTADTPVADGVELIDACFFPLDALPPEISDATLRRVDEVAGRRARDGRW